MGKSVAVEFVWRHGGKNVLLTGTFDNWKSTIQMTRRNKNDEEFVATVNLDPAQKHLFKYVVDGVWRCSGEFPTESDPQGNVNNWRVPLQEGSYKISSSKSQEKLSGGAGGSSVSSGAPRVPEKVVNGLEKKVGGIKA